MFCKVLNFEQSHCIVFTLQWSISSFHVDDLSIFYHADDHDGFLCIIRIGNEVVHYLDVIVFINQTSRVLNELFVGHNSCKHGCPLVLENLSPDS